MSTTILKYKIHLIAILMVVSLLESSQIEAQMAIHVAGSVVYNENLLKETKKLTIKMKSEISAGRKIEKRKEQIETTIEWVACQEKTDSLVMKKEEAIYASDEKFKKNNQEKANTSKNGI